MQIDKYNEQLLFKLNEITVNANSLIINFQQLCTVKHSKKTTIKIEKEFFNVRKITNSISSST